MKNQMIKKFCALLAVTMLGAFMITGCGPSRFERQQAFLTEGISKLEAGDYEAALSDFQSGLDLSKGKIEEDELTLCYYKAEAQIRSNDLEGAMATYQALLDYKEDAKTYYLRGNLNCLMGDGEAAKEDYKKAVKLDEKNLDLYINIYDSLKNNGEEELGITYLEQAVELGGNGTMDSFQKGRIQYALGNYESAKGYLSTALKGKIAEANFYLAEIATIEGDSATAAEYIKAYLDSGEAQSTGLEQLGIDELNAGNYDQAIIYFKDGLSLESVPNKQGLMRNLIIAYEQKLDFNNAYKTMEDYLSLYPEDEEAKREAIFLDTRVNGIDTSLIDAMNAANESELETEEGTEASE